MDHLDLNISINGPSAAVHAFVATMVAKASSEPYGPPVDVPHSALMPRIGQPWPHFPGSAYAGIARGEGEEPDGHLVLLADEPPQDLTWQAAIDWAQGLGDGARLPTRLESALLYANLQSHFDTDRYHWTGSQYSAGDAWFQLFYDGTQDNVSKSYEARARAVRRFKA